MSYNIKFSNQSTKYFRKLPKNIQIRLKDKFKEISKDPTRFLEHYEGKYHKLRIGGYRALADIDNKRKIIFIRVFDKRGRVYKN